MQDGLKYIQCNMRDRALITVEKPRIISCIYLVASKIQIQVVSMTIVVLCMNTTILFFKYDSIKSNTCL